MEVIAKSGLRFELVGEKPYQKKDGSMIQLKVWISACKECGAPFNVFTPSHAEKTEDANQFKMLHCEEHRLTKEQVRQRGIDAMRRMRDFPAG